ncbi:MAG: bifunctional DNA primase/polymerase [Dichotomicrobium sp.]
MDDLSNLDAALRYRGLGWAVIPAAEQGKAPLVRWHQYQDDLPSEIQIKYWFNQSPNANIAVITGAISGIVVLDIEPNRGGDKALKELTAKHGPLPKTVEAITGDGGFHLYFAHPGGSVPTSLSLAEGIELRADGGGVIVPPSIHPSGKRYAWKEGCSPLETNPAPPPKWLWQEQALERQDWDSLIGQTVAEEQRNNRIISILRYLDWIGVQENLSRELIGAWNQTRCNPPLSADELDQIFHRVRRESK